MVVIVTGGAGFIGSNFIFYMLDKYPNDRIVYLDKLTYAENLSTLASVMNCPNIHSELGWLPKSKFEDGIRKNIAWYLETREWWETIISGEYRDYYRKMYSISMSVLKA